MRINYAFFRLPFCTALLSLSLFCTQNLFFAVALVKESCHLLDAGLDGPVMVRLLHQETNKYICFNKRGRIRTVVSLIFQKEIRWLFFLYLPLFLLHSQPTHAERREIYMSLGILVTLLYPLVVCVMRLCVSEIIFSPSLGMSRFPRQFFSHLLLSRNSGTHAHTHTLGHREGER